MKVTTTDTPGHVKITSAGLTALLVTVVGQLVAFIPTFAPYKAVLISAGTAVIAAAWLLANARHALAGSNVSIDDLKSGIDGYLHAAVSKIDFNTIAKDAVDAKGVPSVSDIEAIASAEVRKLLSGALAPAPVASTTIPVTGAVPPPPAVA
jgi:hypothetical protein